ncbi:MAG: hypothetical protein U0359_17370 [Byssovorax sp.]
MMSGSAPRPWWWLDTSERAALGLGTSVRRTEQGIVFGDPERSHRLEIVARTPDAPVRLGPIALRIWGDARDPRAKALLVGAVERLGPRLAEGFDPAAIDPAELQTAAADRPPTILDVPSTCERACIFCHISQVPLDERAPRGSEADVLRRIDAAEGPILFTGDDALSNPALPLWIERATSRGLSASVIGPPRLHATAALAPALARAGLRKYTTALLGPTAELHDHIGGKAGAFAALTEAVPAMKAAGITVELLTPLIAPLLDHIEPIAAKALALTGSPLTLIAYAPDPVVGHAFDAVVPPFAALREALTRASHVRASVDALPLCVLPEPLRAARARLERTDTGLRMLFPEATCTDCSMRDHCPGVAETILAAVGPGGLIPLRLSPQQPQR